jgi:hypothetical protein
MRAPPENPTPPGANRRGGNVLAIDGWKHPLSSQYRPAVQVPLFTARPRGTPQGEAVKLGDFPRRALALNAAAVMADACGGRWLP